MFEIAEAYERQRGRSSKLLARPFADFVGCRGDVLDVGCGTGALTFVIAQSSSVSGITGLDKSEAFVAYAVSRSNDVRIRFEQGDAHSLPFPDANFDCCLSLLLIGFLSQPEQAAKEMSRVTRRGGVVATAWWDHTGGNDFNEAMYRMGRSLFPERAQPVTSLNKFGYPDALASLWKAADLTDVKTRNIEFRCSFPSFQAYWEPLTEGQGPDGAYIRSLSSSQQNRLRDALRIELLGDDVLGPFSLRARAWGVRGRVQ